jgi:hypothetical protein
MLPSSRSSHAFLTAIFILILSSLLVKANSIDVLSRLRKSTPITGLNRNPQVNYKASSGIDNTRNPNSNDNLLYKEVVEDESMVKLVKTQVTAKKEEPPPLPPQQVPQVPVVPKVLAQAPPRRGTAADRDIEINVILKRPSAPQQMKPIEPPSYHETLVLVEPPPQQPPPPLPIMVQMESNNRIDDDDNDNDSMMRAGMMTVNVCEVQVSFS